MVTARIPALILLLAGLLAAITPAIAQPVATVRSPDGSIVVAITRDNDGRAAYEISRNGAPVIASSRLGLLLADSQPFVRGLAIEQPATSRFTERWEQPWGENRFVDNRYNQLTFTLRETAGARRALDVIFRVYDDGVGFRYAFPDQPGLKTVRITDEVTEFNIARPGTAWWINGGEWNRYEYLYQRTPIDGVSTAHTPITMRLDDGTHLAIHEAALVDYAAMWLKRTAGLGFRATLSPAASGPRVVRDAPFATPWRTIRIAANAAKLYESNLELNLNEPNKLGDVSWFKPHKYIGIWWEMHLGKTTWGSGPRHGATTENARRYIDFAAAHGFRGVLIEGWNTGWDGTWFGHGGDFSFTQAYPDFDLKAVTDYARKKGVHLIGHHETGGNIANYESQLGPALDLYASLGVDAIKTGYVADAGGIIAPDGADGTRFEWHDGQRQVQHHLLVVTEAAKRHIAINPHEPVKDTGLRRTYPNWVSREGARGMEYNAWGSPTNPANHEATLVFTRMLAGPMDFTPGVLSLAGQGDTRLNSTLAKQLALYIVLYSPIQMAADLPENLIRYPRELDFISKVPTDWTETRVLDGAVGEYAAIARKDRGSDDWYIGAVTDDSARAVSVALDFLDPGRVYRATIYRDGDGADYRTEGRHTISIETRTVRRGDTLTLGMAPGGGFAVRIAAPASGRRR